MNEARAEAAGVSRKIRIATCSLAGCFGCHTSLLDIDERLIDLLGMVEFDRTPFTDIKHCGPCDIGIVEGGVSNAENARVLGEFRKNCKVLVAIGPCAITGNVPALRNDISLWDCFQEIYLYEAGAEGRQIPNDPELPLPFDKVYPVGEVVKVDYFLNGCPPSPDVIWKFLVDLIQGREPELDRESLRYD